MVLPLTFVRDFHDKEKCARMKYRPFGKTGLQVSELSLGGAQFSALYGEIDEDESIATIHEAIKSGINYLDTAPFYGQGRSEEIYGKALKDIPRGAYYIATKVGRYEKTADKMFDFSAEKTKQSFERSLKLLGLDYVDVIQIHDIEFAPNLDVVIKETLPVLEGFVKEGKAKFIGITGYPLKTLEDFIRMAPGRLDMILTYSRNTLFDNSLEEYIPFFREHNLGMVCAAGHGLGLLTNSGQPDWHPASEELKEICRKARSICKEAGIELAKLAIHHFMQLEYPSTFLVGMESRKLLEINLSGYLDGLTKKEQEVLKHLQQTLFNKSMSWEGIELERYWAEMKKK